MAYLLLLTDILVVSKNQNTPPFLHYGLSLTLMDTKFIKTLLAVVDAGSYAGAARRENMTPAAVAQRIRSLEAELGQNLIIRAGQHVMPTQECLLILPRLGKIAKHMEQVSLDLLENTGVYGNFFLGAISTALSDRVPFLLAQFAKHAPTASLNFIPGTSKDLYTKLLNDEVDAAFVVHPPFNIPKSVACLLIEEQPFVMIVPANDDRSVEKIISSEKALIYDSTSWGGQLVMPWIQKWIPHDRILCELDALEAIAIAVGHGIGYSIVPDWKGLAGLASVKRIPLPQLALNRKLVLLHRRLNHASVRLFTSEPLS